MRRATIRPLLPAMILGLLGIASVQAAPNDLSTPHRSGPVPGQYIIVLNDDVAGVPVVASEMARAYGLELGMVYRNAIKGFSARIPAGMVAAIENDPDVAYVEQDQWAYAFAQELPTGITRSAADTVTDSASAGVLIDGVDDVRVDVDVAVIDTGIDASHPDLNVAGSVNCAKGGPLSQSCSGGGDDGNGHGTHVAGTIAALDNDFGVVGVAPGARLWSVKVLGNSGSGYMSWIVAGIDWVTANAGTIKVANMSFGCECSSAALNDAINRAVGAGIVFVAAAGNNATDASAFSPANHPGVITVSALADFDGISGGLGVPTCRTDEDDTLAIFSNYGPLVEVAAPGVCIHSTWKGGTYNTISGTSMAAPHVSGAAALLASQGMSADEIKAAIPAAGNFDWVDDSKDGIQEPLLDLHGVAARTVAAPQPATDPGNGGGATGDFALNVATYKVKGVQHADLSWEDTGVTTYDVLRDGVVIAPALAGTVYTDNIGAKGGGSYVYQVCETDTNICSNEATAAF